MTLSKKAKAERDAAKREEITRFLNLTKERADEAVLDFQGFLQRATEELDALDEGPMQRPLHQGEQVSDQ